MKFDKKRNKTQIIVQALITIIFLALVSLSVVVPQAADSKEGKEYSNRLKNSKSPYLLQHADNPVDWYPWEDAAFAKAQKEDKPIFLSIGYSTCHWCHVMEHESFEDPQVAELMNDTFVSIKVDREERPDIDNVYMKVCHMMRRGSCGWPLTIFMTPDKKPFFAATYIPKKERFGRTGLMELIPNVGNMWENNRDKLLASADEITSALEKSARASGSGGEMPDKSTLDLAFKQMESRFDSENGGFGTAPKFSSPHDHLFLLRYWNRTGSEKALGMVEKTLREMRLGGIYDHIGFGFHRYSTDKNWLVPHFEKMLYDQAMLAMAYTEAYQATEKEEYRETAEEIFSYVLRDMTDLKGGFYSAEDADSERKEGKFYIWTKEEITKVLGKDKDDLFINVFNIKRNGNFSGDPEEGHKGKNIPHLHNSLTEIASRLNVSKEKLDKSIEEAQQKLFTAREKRIHPYKDDKVITDWNGLMIAAFAKAAKAFDEPRYEKAARRAADFILGNMRTKDGRLLHRYREGEAGIQANLDDYAFFVWGLIELYESNFDTEYLKSALDLNDKMIKFFWDEKSGGFYFTPDDGEKLLVRQKEIHDGAIPSGNSVAMFNLLRLGRITANPELEEKASQIGRAFSNQFTRAPSAFSQSMAALDLALGTSYEVVIVGDPESPDTEAMLDALRIRFIPNKVVLLRPPGEAPVITNIAEFTKSQSSIDGKSTAYVCQNYICDLPTNDINKMLELLKVKEIKKAEASE